MCCFKPRKSWAGMILSLFMCICLRGKISQVESSWKMRGPWSPRVWLKIIRMGMEETFWWRSKWWECFEVTLIDIPKVKGSFSCGPPHSQMINPHTVLVQIGSYRILSWIGSFESSMLKQKMSQRWDCHGFSWGGFWYSECGCETRNMARTMPWWKKLVPWPMHQPSRRNKIKQPELWAPWSSTVSHDLLPKDSWMFWPRSIKKITCLIGSGGTRCIFGCLHATKNSVTCFIKQPAQKTLQACNHGIHCLLKETWSVFLQWFSDTIAPPLHNNSKVQSPNQFGNLEIVSVHKILKIQRGFCIWMPPGPSRVPSSSCPSNMKHLLLLSPSHCASHRCLCWCSWRFNWSSGVSRERCYFLPTRIWRVWMGVYINRPGDTTSQQIH